MSLTALTDDELMAGLHAIHVEGRRLLARLVLHLVEVEERRLHLKAACSSMFDFCVRQLAMSEGAAFRRINAARLVRRFPGLVRHIESGAIHLSALVMLRDHLTERNVEELVSAASGKSKRALEELLARRAPRPDVPALLRKLPSARSSPVAANDTPSPSSRSTEAPAPARASEPARLEPLAPARYKLQLTASSELRDKLERARALMSHRNPSGDLAVVVEAAVDALLAKLEKERLGKTPRPRRQVDARAAQRGRVPRAVRREVFERDGEQCTFVDDAGHRCPARAFLELDHIDARALGGPDATENLRVLCRAHNRLHAEDVFSAPHVARRIHLRQHKSRLESHGADAGANADASGSDGASAGAGDGDTGRVGAGAGAGSAGAGAGPGAGVGAGVGVGVGVSAGAGDAASDGVTESVGASGSAGKREGGSAGAASGSAMRRPAHRVDRFDLAARGLKNMGFRDAEVRHALFTIDARHRDVDGGLEIEDMLREALAVLT